MRDRAYRRYMNEIKIKHKIKYGYMIDFHECPGKLRKGKNFCSCSCCTPKTNEKGKTMCGSGGKGKSGSKINYSTRNWKNSDQKKIARCEASLDYWESGDCRYYMEWEYDLTYNEKVDSQWLYINGELILRRKPYKKY